MSKFIVIPCPELDEPAPQDFCVIEASTSAKAAGEAAEAFDYFDLVAEGDPGQDIYVLAIPSLKVSHFKVSAPETRYKITEVKK